MTTTEPATLDGVRTAPEASTAAPATTGHRRWTAGARRLTLPAGLLVAYLLCSLGLWWQVWSGHPTSTFLCGCGDPGQYLWFFAAPADALRHGHLPFFTGADYRPGGVNMMDNPGVLGLAIAVAPVTWAFGPVAAVNLVLLLTPALSALAGYAVLRRWVRWWPAAALGGAFYGFSPFAVSGLEYVHLQSSFLVLPALVLLCLDELLVRQRRRPVPVGIGLGVLLAAQYLVSPEMLVLTAVVAAVGVVLLVAYAAAHRPEELRQRLPGAVRGLGAGLATSLVLVGYPVWFALEGPRHTVGAPWAFIAETGNDVKEFLVPGSAAGRPAIDPSIFGYYGDPGPGADYLGPTVLAAVAATVVLLRRSRLVWFAAAVVLVVAALSLGIVFITSPASLIVHPHQHHHTQWWLPWNLMARLPLVDEASPSRLSGILDLFVALVCVVGLDRLVDRLRRRPGPGAAPGARPAPGRGSTDDRPSSGVPDAPSVGAGGTGRRRRGPLVRWLPETVALGLAAAVLVPVGLTYRLPLRTTTVQAPLWFRTAADHLPADAVVLALPWGLSQTSVWQAVGGMRFAMAGGDAFVPGPDGHVLQRPLPGSAEKVLTDLSTFARKPDPTPTVERTMRRALRRWGVTTVVVSTDIGPPAYAVGFLSAVLGTVPTEQDGAWVWSDVAHAPASWPVPAAAVLTCRPGSTPPLAVARCVEGLAHHGPTAGGPSAT